MTEMGDNKSGTDDESTDYDDEDGVLESLFYRLGVEQGCAREQVVGCIEC